jgi:hypothetical protein
MRSRSNCRPLEETRGPNSPCQWLAECEVDGRRFMARSRHGAVYELARVLVAAGVADRPLCVAGHMTWPSFVAAARMDAHRGGRDTAAQEAMEEISSLGWTRIGQNRGV